MNNKKASVIFAENKQWGKKTKQNKKKIFYEEGELKGESKEKQKRRGRKTETVGAKIKARKIIFSFPPSLIFTP